MRRESLTLDEAAEATELIHFAELTDAPIPALCGVELAPRSKGLAPLATYAPADVTCPACRSALLPS